MSKIKSDKYCTEQERNQIFENEGLPLEYKELYHQRFEYEIQELIDEGGFTKEEIRETAIYSSLLFVKKYSEILSLGHSKLWAELYANDYTFLENHIETFDTAYQAMIDANATEARKTLEMDCQINHRSKVYTQTFIRFMEQNRGYTESEKLSQSYEIEYNSQIVNHHSEIFAHKYAHCKTIGECTEVYAYAYAEAYEKAMLQNKSVEYAEIYADKYSKAMQKHFKTVTHFENEPKYHLIHTHILGHMMAWEYAMQNKIENAEQFVLDFADNYIVAYKNAYQLPDFNPEILKESLLNSVVSV